MLSNFYKPFHSNILHTQETAERANGERHLGADPKSGEAVYVETWKNRAIAN